MFLTVLITIANLIVTATISILLTIILFSFFTLNFNFNIKNKSSIFIVSFILLWFIFLLFTFYKVSERDTFEKKEIYDIIEHNKLTNIANGKFYKE